MIIGENGCGKTSILESIYFMASLRSHRGASSSDLINIERDYFSVLCRIIERNEKKYEICVNRDGKRIIKINDIKKEESEYLLPIKVVLFSPDDHQIIKGNPNRRRAYLDGILCQCKLEFRHIRNQYIKVLKQRNAVLKSIFCGEEKYSSLEPWTEQMISYGSKIVKMRKQAIHKINEELLKSETKNIISIKYVDTIKRAEEIGLYREEIFKIQNEEIKRKQSLCGPHRDDLSFLLDQKDCRQYASQGEQRMVLMSLKRAEKEYIKKITEAEPILLLDDAFSELDTRNQKRVMEMISPENQAILTSTNINEAAKEWNIIKI